MFLVDAPLETALQLKSCDADINQRGKTFMLVLENPMHATYWYQKTGYVGS